MTTYIPSIPWERSGKEGDVIALIDKCMSDGYSNRERLFDLIAVHGSEWAMQSLPKQWSMRALAVVAYLDGLDLSKIPTKELPFDTCRELARIAQKWRHTSPTEDFWTSCNAYEYHIALTARQLWPEPDTTGHLMRSCDILACMFKAQYTFRTLLEGSKVPCEAAPLALTNWLERQVATERQASAERNPAVERLYIDAVVFPGETDAHARAESGVFSQGGRDILDSQRPNVATEAICTLLSDFDTLGACGVLYFYAVATLIKKSCQYDWIRSNLFFDFQMSSDLQVFIPNRDHPWIVLICNTYFVRHPRSEKSYFSKDSREAIYMWFKLFWEDENEEFFDGYDYHCMTGIASNCPLRRAAFAV
jgi:hypothetical protein